MQILEESIRELVLTYLEEIPSTMWGIGGGYSSVFQAKLWRIYQKDWGFDMFEGIAHVERQDFRGGSFELCTLKAL